MRRHLSCLAAFGLVLAFGGTSQANLIQNGSFETASGLTTQDTTTLVNQGFVTLYSPSTAIDGWTVTGDSIDYIGSHWTAADGSRSIDLDGNGQGGLTASTNFSVAQGVTYLVQFSMAGNVDGLPTVKTVEASAGGVTQDFTFDTTGHTLTDMGWVVKSFSFTAASTGTTSLSFSSLDAGYYGTALDNVIVTAVPEPASLAMCGTALVSIAGAALRRRRKGDAATV